MYGMMLVEIDHVAPDALVRGCARSAQSASYPKHRSVRREPSPAELKLRGADGAFAPTRAVLAHAQPQEMTSGGMARLEPSLGV